MKLALLLPVAATLVAYLTACATYRAGPQAAVEPIERTSKYTLGIVEFDDQGWFRDRDQAKAVISAVDEVASAGGASIVIFVHGWHHSARPDDSNLLDFKQALERLNDELELKVYRDARAQLFGSPEARVVGVYVGWRGLSLPGFLDYLTFWDRKAAAIRVGHGDVAELFTRIHDIYLRNNKAPKYTGLVTIGHSFGGQVAYAAVSDILKSRIASAVSLTDESAPAQVIGGFGDLVVLVNPAFEASAFHRVSELTRARPFAIQQTPVLLVVSSEADGANRAWFPFGRWFGVLGEPRGSARQFVEKTHALGWYSPQVTHCLALAEGAACRGFPDRSVPQRKRNQEHPAVRGATDASSHSLDVQQAIRNAGAWRSEDAAHPETIALAGELGMAGTRFFRVDPAIDVNLPFVVAKATPDVMAGHNDMFNPNFVNFLIRYAAGAELKRVSIAMQNLAR